MTPSQKKKFQTLLVRIRNASTAQRSITLTPDECALIDVQHDHTLRKLRDVGDRLERVLKKFQGLPRGPRPEAGAFE